MDQASQALAPLPKSMSLFISTSTAPSSGSCLAEITNTFDSNGSADTIAAQKCHKSPSLVQHSKSFYMGTEYNSAVMITERSPIDISCASSQHPGPSSNHVVRDESRLSLPFVLRRKKQHPELARQVGLTFPPPTPDITPNQVIWAPIGSSGWVNVSNTSPRHASYLAPTIPVSKVATFDDTYASPRLESPSRSLPASRISTTENTATGTIFPAPTSSDPQPGVCILQRSAAFLQAHRIMPNSSKSQSIPAVIYSKADIAEIKATLPVVPVKLRRMHVRFVREQESRFPSGSRASRIRKTERLGSRSSLRIKAKRDMAGHANKTR